MTIQELRGDAVVLINDSIKLLNQFADILKGGGGLLSAKQEEDIADGIKTASASIKTALEVLE